MLGKGFEALVRFSRSAATRGAAADILHLLAKETVTHTAAGAAVVVEITASAEGEVMSAEGVPEVLGKRFPLELVGPDLGHQLLASSAARFTHVHTELLVCDGDLFGALVLLHNGKISDDDLALVNGLCDVAAAAVHKAYQYDELHRAFTELQASRELLMRSEKLRALGQMAAGISHDLKNILNPLFMQVTLVKRVPTSDPEKLKRITDSMESVLQLGLQTIERLRLFSRQAPESLGLRASLNKLVEDAAELTRPRLKAGSGGNPVELTIDLGSPPPVLVDGAELTTAVLNLLVNAVEAMPRGGHITLKTGRDEGGGWIEVGDDGPGMPPAVRDRIFEPFFTTKGTEGTGLGLAMVYALVQRHRGRITVESVEGKGTTFRLWFPQTKESASGAA